MRRIDEVSWCCLLNMLFGVCHSDIPLACVSQSVSRWPRMGSCMCQSVSRSHVLYISCQVSIRVPCIALLTSLKRRTRILIVISLRFDLTANKETMPRLCSMQT